MALLFPDADSAKWVLDTLAERLPDARTVMLSSGRWICLKKYFELETSHTAPHEILLFSWLRQTETGNIDELLSKKEIDCDVLDSIQARLGIAEYHPASCAEKVCQYRELCWVRKREQNEMEAHFLVGLSGDLTRFIAREKIDSTQLPSLNVDTLFIGDLSGVFESLFEHFAIFLSWKELERTVSLIQESSRGWVSRDIYLWLERLEVSLRELDIAVRARLSETFEMEDSLFRGLSGSITRFEPPGSDVEGILFPHLRKIRESLEKQRDIFLDNMNYSNLAAYLETLMFKIDRIMKYDSRRFAFFILEDGDAWSLYLYNRRWTGEIWFPRDIKKILWMEEEDIIPGVSAPLFEMFSESLLSFEVVNATGEDNLLENVRVLTPQAGERTEENSILHEVEIMALICAMKKNGRLLVVNHEVRRNRKIAENIRMCLEGEQIKVSLRHNIDFINDSFLQTDSIVILRTPPPAALSRPFRFALLSAWLDGKEPSKTLVTPFEMLYVSRLISRLAREEGPTLLVIFAHELKKHLSELERHQMPGERKLALYPTVDSIVVCDGSRKLFSTLASKRSELLQKVKAMSLSALFELSDVPEPGSFLEERIKLLFSREPVEDEKESLVKLRQGASGLVLFSDASRFDDLTLSFMVELHPSKRIVLVATPEIKEKLQLRLAASGYIRMTENVDEWNESSGILSINISDLELYLNSCSSFENCVVLFLDEGAGLNQDSSLFEYTRYSSFSRLVSLAESTIVFSTPLPFRAAKSLLGILSQSRKKETVMLRDLRSLQILKKYFSEEEGVRNAMLVEKTKDLLERGYKLDILVLSEKRRQAVSTFLKSRGIQLYDPESSSTDDEVCSLRVLNAFGVNGYEAGKAQGMIIFGLPFSETDLFRLLGLRAGLACETLLIFGPEDLDYVKEFLFEEKKKLLELSGRAVSFLGKMALDSMEIDENTFGKNFAGQELDGWHESLLISVLETAGAMKVERGGSFNVKNVWLSGTTFPQDEKEKKVYNYIVSRLKEQGSSELIISFPDIRRTLDMTGDDFLNYLLMLREKGILGWPEKMSVKALLPYHETRNRLLEKKLRQVIILEILSKKAGFSSGMEVLLRTNDFHGENGIGMEEVRKELEFLRKRNLVRTIRYFRNDIFVSANVGARRFLESISQETKLEIALVDALAESGLYRKMVLDIEFLEVLKSLEKSGYKITLERLSELLETMVMEELFLVQMHNSITRKGLKIIRSRKTASLQDEIEKVVEDIFMRFEAGLEELYERLRDSLSRNPLLTE